MDLGRKLLEARLEAGLSQRQLAGEEITRNMLSQIEHGTAQPSLGTLQYLARRLGKTVGYFLEEQTVSPNQPLMAQARTAFDAGDWAGALEALNTMDSTDPAFAREAALLQRLCFLSQGAQALAQGREPYARQLLEKAARCPDSYCAPLLERQRLLLLGRIRGQKVANRLPPLDEELLLRAREALDAGDARRAGALLEAAQGRDTSWQLLRGQAHLALEEYPAAAVCLEAAFAADPASAAPLLEICCRELGDYKRAYELACLQRQAATMNG